MRIEHIAIWVQDPESVKNYYSRYFGASIGKEYHNPAKNFRSWFLSFQDGARIELMHNPDIPLSKNSAYQQFTGLVHFAVSVGSKEKVDALTSTLKEDGFEILDAPRTTGDGYYESVVLDPENNRIEITI